MVDEPLEARPRDSRLEDVNRDHVGSLGVDVHAVDAEEEAAPVGQVGRRRPSGLADELHAAQADAHAPPSGPRARRARRLQRHGRGGAPAQRGEEGGERCLGGARREAGPHLVQVGVAVAAGPPEARRLHEHLHAGAQVGASLRLDGLLGAARGAGRPGDVAPLGVGAVGEAHLEAHRMRLLLRCRRRSPAEARQPRHEPPPRAGAPAVGRAREGALGRHRRLEARAVGGVGVEDAPQPEEDRAVTQVALRTRDLDEPRRHCAQLHRARHARRHEGGSPVPANVGHGLADKVARGGLAPHVVVQRVRHLVRVGRLLPPRILSRRREGELERVAARSEHAVRHGHLPADESRVEAREQHAIEPHVRDRVHALEHELTPLARREQRRVARSARVELEGGAEGPVLEPDPRVVELVVPEQRVGRQHARVHERRVRDAWHRRGHLDCAVPVAAGPRHGRGRERA